MLMDQGKHSFIVSEIKMSDWSVREVWIFTFLLSLLKEMTFGGDRLRSGYGQEQ